MLFLGRAAASVPRTNNIVGRTDRNRRKRIRWAEKGRAQDTSCENYPRKETAIGIYALWGILSKDKRPEFNASFCGRLIVGLTNFNHVSKKPPSRRKLMMMMMMIWSGSRAKIFMNTCRVAASNPWSDELSRFIT